MPRPFSAPVRLFSGVRTVGAWLGALALSLALMGAAQADKRVALVVGNGAYRYLDPLVNPRLDARAMKAALARLGFTVVYGEDLDQKRLGQKIAEFADAAQGADVALTYYAGHGSTFGDMSYIVPVDAEFKSLAAVTYELVPLEQMLGELRRAKGVRIAIVDACRDNARERELKRMGAQRGGEASRGLGRVQSSDGLILAFATQYGMTAADGPPNTNSPFTAALLRHLPTPGLDVRDVFFNAGRDVLLSTNSTQRPAIEVSLYDRYTLVAAPPAGVVSSVAPAPAPVQTPAQMAALPPVVPTPQALAPPPVAPAPQAPKPTIVPPGMQQALPVAIFGDWNVFVSGETGDRICYAIAQPSTRSPKTLKRDDAYMFVSSRKKENIQNEIAVMLGFDLKPAASQVKPGAAPVPTDPSLTLGDTRYGLVTKNGNAWIQNIAEEGQVVAKMSDSKANLTIRTTSARGTSTRDEYALAGFDEAMRRVRQECR